MLLKKRKSEQASTMKQSEWIEKTLCNISGYLTRQSGKLSTGAKKAMLLLFGFIVGSLSLLLILGAFSSKSLNQGLESVSIKFPPVIQSIEKYQPLSTEEYLKILQFKQTLDSLKNIKDDRTIYDKLLKERKSLMDSMDFILNIYK